MMADEAKKILHPDTSRSTLARYEYYGGFRGEQAVKEAVDEACLVACEALERHIPVKPEEVFWFGDIDMYAGECPLCKGWVKSEYDYCPKCGTALAWEGFEHD